MKHGIGITFIPLSWHVGVWRRPHKDILSIGPIRLVYYRLRGEWKTQP